MPKKDTPASLFTVYLKGMLMGIADIVPGVSGGTIALITGIYHRLISAISSVNPKLLLLWRQQGLVKGFFTILQKVDAIFLVCLFLGMVTSVVTASSFISGLLENEPLKVWSFFFGLVAATVLVLLAQIREWTRRKVMLFLIGCAIAVAISQSPAMSGTPSLPFLFFAGSIAICAMILPGVSGSFILLLLGAYQAVLDAVNDQDIITLATVFAGMITGLLVFSNFLKWLLSHYYQQTLSVLTGFIAGSLVKLYPWKITMDGAPFNVLHWHYPEDPQAAIAYSLMLAGAALVFLLAWIGKKSSSGTMTH